MKKETNEKVEAASLGTAESTKGVSGKKETEISGRRRFLQAGLVGSAVATVGPALQPVFGASPRNSAPAVAEAADVPAFELAQIEIGIGNSGGALACLEHAVIGRESFAIFLKAWPSFRSLRAEPRFRGLLAQIGLES